MFSMCAASRTLTLEKWWSKRDGNAINGFEVCSMFLWIEKCEGRLVSESGMAIERNRGGFGNFDF